MAKIHEYIYDAAIEFEAKTGHRATNVYLGEAEMKAVLRWAFDNDYLSSIDADIRGKNRPEINGLIVYAVNDATHIACA